MSTTSHKNVILNVIAEWLDENGITAVVETSIPNPHMSWVSTYYSDNKIGRSTACNVGVRDGNIRVGGYGKDRDIPLALPNSLDILVLYIKSFGSYDKDMEI